jgi:hypothetical protein
MQTYETLKHTKWECKYHVMFIPRCQNTPTGTAALAKASTTAAA